MMGENVNSKSGINTSHSVKLSSLGNMVKWLSANNDYLFKKEFEDVEEETKKFVASEGLKPYNRAKNRYSSIVSYDHSRVKLQSTGEDGSDYINASWIEGEGGRPRMYIAAQAPLQYTVCDMWRMVWEYRVRVIIMTTTLMEGGKEKCVQYWPASVGDVLTQDSSRIGGELKIMMKSSESQTHWQHRVFTVEEITQEQERDSSQTVHHYHFIDWPDRRVPSSPSTLLHLLHHIHTAHPLSSSPLLVHCSAGVGRTGTLLAVDRLLHQVQAGAQTVNVLQTVRELRRCRPRMVDNELQYKFIYSCLDYIISNSSFRSSNTLAADDDLLLSANTQQH